jgi:hypothetical protein
MELYEEMKDSITYGDMPEKLPAFVTVWQKQANRICQRRTEKAVQNTGGGICFASARAPPDSAGSIAGYTGPEPMNLSAGKRRISAEEKAKRFVDGRCLYCWGYNHRAAECVAKKKTQMFKAAGAEFTEEGT